MRILRNDNLAVVFAARLAEKGLNSLKVSMAKALMPEKKFLLGTG
jgi:hypothetical protein